WTTVSSPNNINVNGLDLEAYAYYFFNVRVSDSIYPATSNIYKTDNIYVNMTLQMNLIEPSFGWTSTEDFTATIETNRWATCKWNLDPFYNFDNIPETKIMGTGNGISHNENFNINDITSNGRAYVYFMCMDEYGDVTPEDGARRYEFHFDPNAPLILHAKADPDNIVSATQINGEWVLMTTFVVETDIPSQCRYSETQINYEYMEGEFPEHGELNEVEVSGFLLESAEYTYNIACKSLADVVGETKQINFYVDPSQDVSLQINSPNGLIYTTSSAVPLEAVTNRPAICQYTFDGDSWVTIGSETAKTEHTTTIPGSNEEGWKMVYVECTTEDYGSDTKTSTYGLDLSPPMIMNVSVPKEVYTKNEIIINNIDAVDVVSPIESYQYELRSASGQVVREWTTASSSSNIHVYGLELEGFQEYYFNIRVNDTVYPAWSNIFKSSNIYVNMTLQMDLVSPVDGWTSTEDFAVTLLTNRGATCKWNLDPFFNYESVSDDNVFSSSNGLTHTVNFNINDITRSGHAYVHFMCMDEYGDVTPEDGARRYEFIYDPNPPVILNAEANPDPVLTETLLPNGIWTVMTTLYVDTNIPSTCRYSETETDYSSMENDFPEQDVVHEVDITSLSLDPETYTYNVACKSLAGVAGTFEQITFYVDPSQELSLSVISPTGSLLTSSSSIVLEVETNRESVCNYSTDGETWKVLGAPIPTTDHIATISGSGEEGKHYVNFKCYTDEYGFDTGTGSYSLDLGPPVINDVIVPKEVYRRDQIYITSIDAEDTVSPITSYEYELRTSSGQVVKEWTTVSSPNNIHVNNLELESFGSYFFNVRVSDSVYPATSNIYKTDNIYVNMTLQMDLISPVNGWTATENFTATLETNRPATCKWSLTSFNDYLEITEDNVFGTSTGLLHTKEYDINEIMISGHAYVYFMCSDSYGDQTPVDAARRYEFFFDPNPPIILSAKASPDNILTETLLPNGVWTLMTTLIVNTDIPSTCRYSETYTDYESMGIAFPTSGTLNEVDVISLNEGTYTFNVACQSLAGVSGSYETLTVTVDPSQELAVHMESPNGLVLTSTSVPLDIYTNRPSTCEYSFDEESWVGFGSSAGDIEHHTSLSVGNEEGERDVYVNCLNEEYGSATAHGTFGLDLNPPHIDDVVVPEQVFVSNSITIESIDVVDAMSSIAELQYELREASGTLIKNWTSFSSTNNVHIGGLALEDAQGYFFNIRAKDSVNPSWSNVFKTDNIFVNLSLQIELLEPSYGWTSEKIFDVVLETNRPATCKYQLTPFRNYNLVPISSVISSSNNRHHTLSGFDMDVSGDHIYVACIDSDGTQSPTQNNGAKIFDFVFNNNAPEFTIVAVPNPVVEELSTGNGTWGLMSTITAESNIPSLCRMSETATTFDGMELEFDNLNLRENEIVIEYGSFVYDYKYNVICRSYADVDSQMKQLIVSVNPSAGLSITIYNPDNLFIGSNKIPVYLNFSVNRASDCIYKLNTSVTQSYMPGLLGSAINTAQLGSSFGEGRYSVALNCSNREYESQSTGYFTVDLTPPKIIDVIVPNVSCRTDLITLEEIVAEDDLSWIDEFEYKLVKSSETIVNWTSTEWEFDINIDEYDNGSDLDLELSNGYAFVVRAKNEVVDAWSNEFTSHNIIVNPEHEDCAYCGDGVCNSDENCTSCSSDCTCGDTCSNNKKDGLETDVNCGGGACSACAIGKSCSLDGDCLSQNCLSGICELALCDNGIFDVNNSETATDCGGINCDPCDSGSDCELDSDCSDGNYCNSNTGVCTKETCDDVLLNQDETDLDCGGDICARVYGQLCELDQGCEENSDCITNTCHPTLFICAEPNCDDGLENGDETDTDCGGGTCIGCDTGKDCDSDSDCRVGTCVNNECTLDKDTDTDGDGMPDYWEDKYDLDKNDPSDADSDSDDDGVSNLDEYTNDGSPQSSDTDDDGYTDKKELDKGTRLNDPNDFPKSTNLFSIILLILLIVALLGGGGYFAYFYFYATPGLLPWPFPPEKIEGKRQPSSSLFKPGQRKPMMAQPRQRMPAQQTRKSSVFQQKSAR
ncbi:hypothetical protein N9934_02590, partial [Desulfosarcina sp.]|nr:hypothetical protein [Desulfosarcina sp.]